MVELGEQLLAAILSKAEVEPGSAGGVRSLLLAVESCEGGVGDY